MKSAALDRADSRPATSTRRDFIRNAGVGAGAAYLFGRFGVFGLSRLEGAEGPEYAMIVVDYSRCTGCRTCETVCAAHNNPVKVGDEMLPGLGNPALARIRVHHFNPDVDVPAVCARCPDTPCVESCPVEADPGTGRKPLYRDEKTGVIHCDLKRCLGCVRCMNACKLKGAGVIRQNPETGQAEGMCTLCDGTPQCVALCPQGALSFVKEPLDESLYRKSPAFIARELARRWYENKGGE